MKNYEDLAFLFVVTPNYIGEIVARLGIKRHRMDGLTYIDEKGEAELSKFFNKRILTLSFKNYTRPDKPFERKKFTPIVRQILSGGLL